MKMKTYKLLTIMFFLMTIVLLIYILQTNIKKNIIVNDSNDFNKYTDNSSDPYTRLDGVLKNLNYNYIYTYKNFSSIYFSIAQYNNTNFSMTEYKVNNNESINISIPQKSTFIISLPGSKTWALSNAKSLNNINLEHTSTIIDWKNNNNASDDYTGIRYHRDNFYFSTISMGTESLQFEYPDGFILNLNITIY